jgi:hypothetical protein
LLNRFPANPEQLLVTAMLVQSTLQDFDQSATLVLDLVFNFENLLSLPTPLTLEALKLGPTTTAY